MRPIFGTEFENFQVEEFFILGIDVLKLFAFPKSWLNLFYDAGFTYFKIQFLGD